MSTKHILYCYKLNIKPNKKDEHFKLLYSIYVCVYVYVFSHYG